MAVSTTNLAISSGLLASSGLTPAGVSNVLIGLLPVGCGNLLSASPAKAVRHKGQRTLNGRAIARRPYPRSPGPEPLVSSLEEGDIPGPLPLMLVGVGPDVQQAAQLSKACEAFA